MSLFTHTPCDTPPFLSFPPLRCACAEQLVKKYGKIAIYTHVALSVMSYGTCYAAVAMGLPIDDFLRLFLSEDKISEAGYVLVASVCVCVW